MSARDDIVRVLNEDDRNQEYADPKLYKNSLSWSGRKYAFKRALKKFGTDGGTDLSAKLTYYTVLSMAPGLLAVFSMLSLVLSSNAEVIENMLDDVITQAVPEDYQALVQNLVETMMDSATGGVIALIIGVITALWSASAYVKAFSRNMNSIYGVAEGRTFIKKNLTMVLTTATVLVGVVVILISLALNRPLVDGLFGPIAEPLGLEGVLAFMTDTFLPLWAWLRYVVVALVLILVIAVMYHFTPNVQKPKFTWFSIGAVVVLVGSAIAGVAMAIYLTYFASYSSYGAVGTIMAVLFVLWIFNMVMLLGALIDHEMFRARQLESGIPAEVHVQLPPRDTAGAEKAKEDQDKLIEEARTLRRTMSNPLAPENRDVD
ncbi:YihY/virulence factor BrkB family protein [Auritidibacter ignavus]|uniref:YihY/virulence factor BrkB family protein n=1 Tax=Auritidibacter ignavus TaxID=678932 RepID=A0AAJ6AF77_9MICC|nr:YihY/virulence factor BrkB family protein [Auritidibacter ignavus]NIH72003.1 membrane protein [Auritidibacter ignavus]WGH92165.1 YihY/virulence factor BrkB family protein [Auritidibacter ignavus]WHS34157.1 YihY/virulence factor BrkB family protein [Auritidibacter ignavus]